VSHSRRSGRGQDTHGTARFTRAMSGHIVGCEKIGCRNFGNTPFFLLSNPFSRTVDMKTKKRNRLLFCENDTRVALVEVKPCISELISERQQQKSH